MFFWQVDIRKFLFVALKILHCSFTGAKLFHNTFLIISENMFDVNVETSVSNDLEGQRTTQWLNKGSQSRLWHVTKHIFNIAKNYYAADTFSDIRHPITAVSFQKLCTDFNRSNIFSRSKLFLLSRIFGYNDYWL